MNFSVPPRRALGALVLYVLSAMGAVHASNVPSLPGGTQEFADYDIHYSTFNSLFVPADIAKIHGLVRAKDQTLINIAVQKKPGAQPIAAEVTGTAKNLMQQVKTIQFKVIDEPDAIYYMGALRHSNEEMLHLDFVITPQGESTPLEFRLTRKLYTEN